MKAKDLLALALERQAHVDKTSAVKVAQSLSHQQVVRSICENGGLASYQEARDGQTRDRRK